MGIAIGDYDRNGFLDIYNSNIPDGNKLLQNQGNQTFIEVAEPAGVAFYGFGWSVNFFDYNNDGEMDLYSSGANTNTPSLNFSKFYQNKGDGDFF